MMNYQQTNDRNVGGIWFKEETVAEKQSRVGIAGMTDRELAKLAIKSKSTLFADTMAEDVLAVLNGNDNLVDGLRAINGLEEATVLSIASMMELARRKTSRKGRSITTPADIFAVIRHFADDAEQEKLIVVGLNGAHEVCFCKVVTTGLLNRTVVHPREVFADALKQRCCAIAIAHNHPSGHVEPSEDDKLVTSRLVSAGELLGIRVIDHLVFSEDGYYSFLEHGHM